MPGERYFSARDRLLACLGRVEELAAASGIETRDAAAEDECARLVLPLKVVALGEVNAGKSTLLNALAGAELCPAGPLPTTRETSWYSHAAVSRDRDQDGWIAAGRPLEFLKRFELIDTPGTNSGWRDLVFAGVPRYEEADLILIVFPSANTWTAATWDMVSALSDEALDRTLLIVQQADQKSPEDLKVIHGHMEDLCVKRVGRALPILAVAARLALESKISPETGRKGWSASGFSAFEKHVSERVCGSPVREHLLRRASQDIGRRLREIESGLDRQRRSMDDDGWFLAGLEREGDALRDDVLETSPKTLAGARSRYEVEVGRLTRSLSRRLGLVGTLPGLFAGDDTAVRTETEFANGLQEAIREFSAADAERLLERCEGHWSKVRPRVSDRMAMDPGNSSVSGEGRPRLVEKFTERVVKAVTVVLGQLRVRASLDPMLRRRNRQLKSLMAVALVLLTVAGVTGALKLDPFPQWFFLAAVAVALILFVVALLTRGGVVRETRRRLLDSAGQFEWAMRGDYGEAVRSLFREYSNGLIGVRRQLAGRKATLEPRAERWTRLYLELKAIEQDLD